MGRAIFDDITPPQESDDDSNSTEHSIRNVAPLSTPERQNRRAKRAERRKIKNPLSNLRRNNNLDGVRSPMGRIGIWVIAIGFLLVALATVGFVFIGKTTISIEPQQESITLSSGSVLTAYQEAQDSELGYKVLSHTIEATDTIAATGKETVQQKASGRIVVYNTHSSATQRLIKNTRFEAPNGEIYRVRNSFTVPGKNDDGTPGTIEVTVYADAAGEEKNISALGTRFTIPGLKGDPRFDTFYAELKTPMIGGFVGERAIVNEDVLNAARTTLREQLRSEVSASIRAQSSDSVELFEGGIFTTFESPEVTYAEGDTATVREMARIYAVTFNKNDLARILAEAAVANPESGLIRIDSPETLVMNIINKSGVDIANDALIQFTLEGQTTLTWEVDTEALKQDLVGKYSGALNTVMSAYPGIKSAQATIRPFWKSEFPSETGRISTEIISKK